ncbi:MAG: hypothetical protein ACE5KZ_01190 [Candidatus Scalinduaceae bacterium]
MKNFIIVLTALLCTTLLISCGGSYEEIDGSSQEAYQKSLASLLNKASPDQQEQIIHILEQKYDHFLSRYPSFFNETIRPPEYLALIDGISFSALLEKADLLIKYNQINSEYTTLNDRFKKIDSVLANYYIERDLAKTAKSVALTFITPQLESNHWITVPIEITNNNEFPIYSLNISFRILEEGRKVPWVDTVETESFGAVGLNSGETVLRELRVFLHSEKRITVRKDFLKFYIQPISATKKSKDTTSLLDTYNQYSIQKIGALEKEREELWEKKIELLIELVKIKNDMKNIEIGMGIKGQR